MDAAALPPPNPRQAAAPYATTARPADLLASLAAALRARWPLIAAIAAAALIAAVVYLRTAEYRHSIDLGVAAAPGSASRTPSLGNLANLAAIAGVGLETEATPFRLYLEDLTSRNTAAELAADKRLLRRVFAREWQDGGWRGDPSLADRLTASLLALSGAAIPAWTPPDAARLHAWLVANVAVTQNPRSPIVMLSMAHPDPAFGKALLMRLHSIADRRARDRALARSRTNIAHLDARIATVSELDHRQAMFATRAAEAQRLMLASNPAPYAATPLGGATASPNPTSPRQGLTLVLALLLGLAAGTALALFLGPPKRR